MFYNSVDLHPLGGGWEVRQGRYSIDLLPLKIREELLERTKH